MLQVRKMKKPRTNTETMAVVSAGEKCVLLLTRNQPCTEKAKGMKKKSPQTSMKPKLRGVVEPCLKIVRVSYARMPACVVYAYVCVICEVEIARTARGECPKWRSCRTRR